jgi:chromosome segregation protein
MLHVCRLRLTGFKSFAEPVELAIEPGLTGIVGPNGCGKSNLVEGLRWGMGETSSRALRGGEMDDVIFAGTATRPGRGFAEVVIDLDNTARVAPPPFTDAAELQVSRRIDRGRGSTYRINGREVRARDVQLLFADHAAGARSAAMVTQGQVAQLIAARPQERRALLEEAAGISGLAARRSEADARLTAAAQNLTRVEDVLATLAVQHQHLAEQAAHAARYRALSAAIRQAEEANLRSDWRRVEAATATAEAELAEAEARLTTATAAAATAAAAQATAAARLVAERREADTATAQLFALTRQGDQLDAEEALLARDIAETTARHELCERELRRARAQAAEALAMVARLERDQERLRAETADEGGRRSALTQQLAALAERLDIAEREVADQEAGLARAEAEHASLQRAYSMAAKRLRLLQVEQQALAERRARQQAATAAVDSEVAARATQAAEQRLNAAQHARAAAEAERRERHARAARAQEDLHRCDRAVIALEAEERMLRQALAAAVPSSGTTAIEALRAPPELASAVGAALGDDAFASLHPQAARCWRPLPPLAPSPPLPEGTRSLAALVAAPPPLQRRLAATAILDDAARAPAVQAQLSPGQCLVTLDGQVWRWDGLVQAGFEASPAASVIAHRERLAFVIEALREARAARAAAQADATAAGKALADAEASEVARRREEEQAQKALAEARQRASTMAAAAARLAAEEAALTEQQLQLDHRLREALAEADAAASAIAALPDTAAERRKGEPARRAVSSLRHELVECRAALTALDREMEARCRREQVLAGEITEWRRRAETADQDVAEATCRLTEAADTLARLAEGPPQLAERRARLETERAAAERRRNAAADALSLAEGALGEADRALRAAEAAVVAAREGQIKAAAAYAEARREREQLAGLIEERLGVDAATVLAGGETDGGASIDARQLERMRRERDLMGAVNLRAEDEAAALMQQIERLKAERTDLEAAIVKLRQAISEIDGESRERLRAAFVEIDRHFRALFSRLFGGGHAELRLTEGDDALTAGVEIYASPPGKRLSLLSLLSGGEQALTAIALRFSLFLARPAPVCVLDEVDAPLDDANVDRFCRLLEELAQTGTRFLVITHHRLTMARMDRLYGVTMVEKGISQIFSVDLRRAEALRHRA